VARGGLGARLELLRGLAWSEVHARLEELEGVAKTAADVMTPNPVTVAASMPLRRVAEIMAKRRLKRLPVVDATGGLAGIVSRVDLLRAAAGRSRPGEDARAVVAPAEAQVARLMREDVPVVTKGAPLPEVLSAVISTRLHHALVVDKDRHVVGLVTDEELMDRMTPSMRPSLLRSLMQSLPFAQADATPAHEPRHPRAKTAEELMIDAPPQVSADTPIASAIAEMLASDRKILAVVDAGGKLLGIVDRADLLRGVASPAEPPVEQHARSRPRSRASDRYRRARQFPIATFSSTLGGPGPRPPVRRMFTRHCRAIASLWITLLATVSLTPRLASAADDLSPEARALQGASARVRLMDGPSPFQYAAYEVSARGPAGVAVHTRGVMGRSEVMLKTELVTIEALGAFMKDLEVLGAAAIVSNVPKAPAPKPKRGPRVPGGRWEVTWELGGRTTRALVDAPYRQRDLRAARFIERVRGFVVRTCGEIAWQPSSGKEDARGWLTVDSVPSAEVEIDGAPTGEETPLFSYQLAPGPHKVTLRRKDRGIVRDFKVVIDAGFITPLEVVLE